MEDIMKVVRSRRSVRTFDGREIGTVWIGGTMDRPSFGDMQKIDLGIALCHFALAAKENGINVSFNINDPGITAGADTEYLASYLLP